MLVRKRGHGACSAPGHSTSSTTASSAEAAAAARPSREKKKKAIGKARAKKALAVGGLGILRTGSVQPRTVALYQASFGEFNAWCKGQDVRLTEQEHS